MIFDVRSTVGYENSPQANITARRAISLGEAEYHCANGAKSLHRRCKTTAPQVQERRCAMKTNTYAGKIGHSGSQKVEAPFASEKKAKGSVIKDKK